MYRRPPDLEGLRDLRGSLALGLQIAHLGGIYRSGAALVDAGRLGLGDPLELVLAAQI